MKTNKKYYLKIIFCLICITTLCSFFALHSNAVNTKLDSVEKIFKLIYNQQYFDAEILLNQSRDKLDNLHFNLLILDLYWWKTISNGEASALKSFERFLSNNKNTSDSGQKKDQIFELINLTYSLRLDATRKYFFGTIGNLYKINTLLKNMNMAEMDPAYLDFFNLYKAVFQIGRHKYLVLNSELKQEGIKVLEGYMFSQNIIHQTISIYFLAKISFELEKNFDKAELCYEKLLTLYPNNTLFKIGLDQSRNKKLL